MLTATKTIDQPINTDKIDYSLYPEIGKDEYQKRIAQLYKLAGEKKMDCLVVYGDREHFSNIEYLTKYDPRFEECLLVLKNGTKPKIITGLEGYAYSQIIPYEIERFVYSGFGLPGQPANSAKLKGILKDCGLKDGERIGIVGWKAFLAGEFEGQVFDIPAYMLELLAQIAGRENLVNATDLFTDNGYGLRNILCPEEIVQAEMINAKASRQVYGVFKELKEGMSELKASGFFGIGGEPMITYPSVSFGEKNVKLGLASPMAHAVLKRGDPVSIGIGYRRAMIHRSALFVRDEQELLELYGEKAILFLKGYFNLVRVWYETLKLGITGGEVYSAVIKESGPIENYGIVLNMGHQIHTEEWINSLFYAGSEYTVRSGMAIQCDIIAGIENPFVPAHVEDGVVIADEKLRKKLQDEYPKAYERMQRRRTFMKDVLNIRLKDEVLPLSDMQGMLFPFAGDCRTILTNP